MIKKLEILILIFIIFNFLTLTVLAEDNSKTTGKLFELFDNERDELGPGNYIYPQFKHFEPYQGLFDLLRFAITEDQNNYLFEFEFAEIRDPWRSKYGFSHPIIELYFDNLDGGSNKLFRPGAKIQFQKDFFWDKMLHISGWWVMAFSPEDRETTEKIVWSDPKHPFVIDKALVELKENVISIRIEKNLLGDLKNSRFCLLVGAFDSFGQNYYREIKIEPDDWAFGGSMNLEYAPRVLDILVQGDNIQEEILKVNPDATDFVTIPDLTIGKQSNILAITEKLGIWIGVVVVLALLGIIVKLKNKKDSISK